SLGSGIKRSDAAGDGSRAAAQLFHQAKVGNLDAPRDQQQVLRLDVQVLKPIVLVHVIEGFGGIAHIRQQFIAGNSGQLRTSALLKPFHQAALRELGNDKKLIVDDLDAFQRQQEGV